MMNIVNIVGRIVISKDDYSEVGVKVQRSYTNDIGEYDYDLIKVVIYGGIKDNVKQYVHNNDIVGVKGRLERRNGELKVICDKVTFLSSKQ